MKVELTNLGIENILALLNKFSFVTGTLGYYISKTKKGMIKEAQIFEIERDKLIKEYGDYDKERDVYTIKPNTESYRMFLEEITPILEAKNEIEIYQISQEEFDKAKIINDECTVTDYELLEDLMVIKDE